MPNLKTAVASYSFHGLLGEGKCDVFNYLNLLRYRYGVDYADIWTGFLPTLDDDFIGKVRAELDRKNLTLANLCVDGPHVWMDTAEARDAHKKQMLDYIKAASKLGAKTIRIDFGGTEGHTMPDEAFEYIVSTYREYCKICYDLGMKIGPENHWGWDRVPEYLKKSGKPWTAPLTDTCTTSATSTTTWKPARNSRFPTQCTPISTQTPCPMRKTSSAVSPMRATKARTARNTIPARLNANGSNGSLPPSAASSPN